HVDFQAVAHAGLFQVLTELAIKEADGGKGLHAAKAGRVDIAQKELHHAEGIGAADACEDWRVLDDGNHLAGHVHHNGVGVAVRHHAAQRAAASHAKAAAVVDDQEVDAA